jgi:hypothetical protein
MINHEVGTDNKTLVARFIEYFSSLPSRSGSISEVGRGDQKSGSTRKDDVSLQRRIAESQNRRIADWQAVRAVPQDLFPGTVRNAADSGSQLILTFAPGQYGTKGSLSLNNPVSDNEV